MNKHPLCLPPRIQRLDSWAQRFPDPKWRILPRASLGSEDTLASTFSHPLVH